MTWMQPGISHDSHKLCYRTTLKFILMDAFLYEREKVLNSTFTVSGKKKTTTNQKHLIKV